MSYGYENQNSTPFDEERRQAFIKESQKNKEK